MPVLTEDRLPDVIRAAEPLWGKGHVVLDRFLDAVKSKGDTEKQKKANAHIAHEALEVIRFFNDMPPAIRKEYPSPSWAFKKVMEWRGLMKREPWRFVGLDITGRMKGGIRPEVFKGRTSDQFRRLLRLKHLPRKKLRMLLTDPGFTDNLVLEALSAAKMGAKDVLGSLPFSGHRQPGPSEVERFAKAREKFGRVIGASRVAGAALPVVLGAKVLPIKSPVAMGATLGALTTPGGLKERLIGGVTGGIALGAAAGIQKAATPAIRVLQSRMLGLGASPSWVRAFSARMAPHISRFALDSAAFTALGAIEHEIRAPSDAERMDLLDMFIGNMAMVGVAMAASRRPRLTFGQKIRRGVDLKRAFAKETGLVGLQLARENMPLFGMHDAVAVELAYRSALRGHNLKPAEVQALIRGGPELLAQEIAPERARDLFAPDRTAIEAATPTPEPKPSRAERLGKRIEDREQRIEKTFAARMERAQKMREEAMAVEREAGAQVEYRKFRIRETREAAKKGGDPRLRKSIFGIENEAEVKALARRRIKRLDDLANKEAERAKRKYRPMLEKAKEIEVSAEAERDFRLDKLKPLRARHKDLIEGQPDLDAVAGVLPENSKGQRIVDEGTIREVNETTKRMAENGVVPRPDSKFDAIDAKEPGGVREMRRALAEAPPENPASPRTSLYAQPPQDPTFVVKRPSILSRIRGIWQTFPAVFGPKLGNRMFDKFTEAAWKEERMSNLMRKKVMQTFRKWHRWLRTPVEGGGPKNPDEAITRIVKLKESGAKAGEHPIETEMLTMMHQVFGRFRRMLKARGKLAGHPIADIRKKLDEGYFPHIFETVHLFGEGAAQRFAEALGTGRIAGANATSRFLRERSSDRSDYVKDVAFVLDAYINSVTRAIYWEPVSRFVNKELPLELQRRVTSFIESKSGELSTATDIPRLQKDVQHALEFARRHVRSALGTTPDGITDLMDLALRKVEARPGMGWLKKRGSPARDILRGYVYAQYVGGLGLNIGSALRNLTQQNNTIAEIGLTWWLRGLKNLVVWDTVTDTRTGLKKLVPRLNPIVRRSGVMGTGRVSDIRQLGRGSVRAAGSRAVQGLSDAALSFFSGAEYLNRSVTYLATYMKAKARGLGITEAKRFAHRMVARTQFNYGRGMGGTAYASPFGHAIFQFTRFPIYQADYLASVIRRGVTGDTSGMLPRDSAIAPMARWAASSYVLAATLGGLGVVFDDGVSFGGLPEPLKVAATRGLEAAAATIEERQTGRTEAGREKGRKIARALNLEPFSGTMGEAVLRSFGPIARQTVTLGDLFFGEGRKHEMAKRRAVKDFVTLFPGLAASRVMRFFEEHRDQQVRSGVTGEVMFPLDPGDKAFGFLPPEFARLLGINTPGVIEKYQLRRDVGARMAAASAKLNVLYTDLRDEYRRQRADGAVDTPALFTKFINGLREIYEQDGAIPDLTFDEIKQRFKRNVIEDVEEGERTSATQRLINRSRILRAPRAEPEEGER